MTEIYVVAKQPWIYKEWKEWLAYYRVTLEDVYLHILELFTPDGDEEDYFYMFDHAFHTSGLLPGSIEYIDQQILAGQMYKHIYEQVIHSPYYELLIRSDLNAIYLINDRDMVLVLGIDP